MAALTYAGAAVAAVRPLADPDVWWHLRTAEWIVDQRAVPLTDPFSAHGMNQPWVAYSWLFEVALLGLYRVFGLPGILVYSVLGALATTLALHALLARYEPSVPRVLAYTVIGLGPIAPLFWPRSYLLSILFFIIELHILLAVRESGRARLLLFLPPLFVLWANVHIQFVYGLFVLGVAAAEPTLQRWLPAAWIGPPSRATARPLWTTLLVCAAMALATPYHVRMYQPLFEHVTHVGTYELISELQAPSFRVPADWIMLAVTLAAVFVLGRRRALPLFPTLLLLAGLFVSFRSVRDVWFVTIVALVIVVGALRSSSSLRYRLGPGQIATAVAAVLVVVGSVVMLQGISPRGLESGMRQKFPVAAAAVVDERNYPGPLYNHYDWGGYLMWRLPALRVSMDGRANVYGPEKIKRSLATWAGEPGWESDPDLERARLVIASRELALAQLLRRDPRFDLAYEDDVATVFVARP